MKRPSRPNPLAERLRSLESAQICLVQAAAALTEPFTGRNLAMAMVLAGTAMLRIAQGSTERDSDDADEIVRALKKRVQ